MTIANFIRSELKKIAFFIQYSGLFEQFDPRMRTIFENLPVEWEQPEVEGKHVPRYETKRVKELSWKDAKVPGKLNGDPIEVIINKTSGGRYHYKIIFLN